MTSKKSTNVWNIQLVTGSDFRRKSVGPITQVSTNPELEARMDHPVRVVNTFFLFYNTTEHSCSWIVIYLAYTPRFLRAKQSVCGGLLKNNRSSSTCLTFAGSRQRLVELPNHGLQSWVLCLITRNTAMKQKSCNWQFSIDRNQR